MFITPPRPMAPSEENGSPLTNNVVNVLVSSHEKIKVFTLHSKITLASIAVSYCTVTALIPTQK